MTYSSSLAVGRERAGSNYGRNQNAVSFRRHDRKLGPISNTVMLIVLACVLGLVRPAPAQATAWARGKKWKVRVNRTEAPSPKEVEGLAVEHCDHAS